MTGEHRWGRFCHRWHLCEQDLQGAMAACGWRSVRKRCLWSSFTVFKVSEWDLKFQDARMVSSCSAKKHSISGPGLIMPQKCQVVRKLDGREATPRPVVLCCVNQHSGCRNYSASEPRTDVNGWTLRSQVNTSPAFQIFDARKLRCTLVPMVQSWPPFCWPGNGWSLIPPRKAHDHDRLRALPPGILGSFRLTGADSLQCQGGRKDANRSNSWQAGQCKAMQRLEDEMAMNVSGHQRAEGLQYHGLLWCVTWLHLNAFE